MLFRSFRVLALDADRKTLFEKDYFKNNKGNPKPDEGFAIPVQAEGAISVVRVELLPVDGRNEPILSLAEVQVFARENKADKEIAWEAKPEWRDGLVHKLEPGDHSAVYLRRNLTAEIAGSQRLSLGSGDAIKVWVNGREVLTKKTKRDAKAGQETVTVALGQGENEVLIKIVNNEIGRAHV